MANTSLSPDISISLDDVAWKTRSVARSIQENPMNEALYYTLLTPIENVLSNLNKDIVHGPQVVLKRAEGKRITDTAIMRIRPEGDLELLALFELKTGPCRLMEWSEEQESPRLSSPDSTQSEDPISADVVFSQSYLQICEQASRALEQLPAHRTIPAFFLTGFYFYLIIFDRTAPVAQPSALQFEDGTEDAGYNPFLQAQQEQLNMMLKTVGLKYEVKFFRERYIDREGRMTAEFAAALQLATEWQSGPVLKESWFTTLAKQAVPNQENIATAEKYIDTGVRNAIAEYEEAIAVFEASSPETDKKRQSSKHRTNEDELDWNPDTSGSMDADSSGNADTSMSTTSSPIASRIHIRTPANVHHSRNQAPVQDADPLPSPFSSPLSPILMSSPEDQQQQQMRSGGHRFTFAILPVPSGDNDEGEEDEDEDEEMASPSPASRTHSNTGPLGFGMS